MSRPGLLEALRFLPGFGAHDLMVLAFRGQSLSEYFSDDAFADASLARVYANFD